jgi:hypothetical protein
MASPRPLSDTNRRTGVLLLILFLGLAALAVAFVILRKFGYA